MQIDFQQNVDLRDYCTFRIGGKAKFLFIAKTNEELMQAINQCNNLNIKFKVIGNGSNLLFDDEGFDGAIIVNQSSKMIFRKNCAYVDAGVNINSLINKCLAKGLSGVEKLAGIPSSIGGAIINNCGAFGQEFGDIVSYVIVCHKSNLTKQIKLTKLDCNFTYRNSIFKNNNYIVLKAKLTLKSANKQDVCNSVQYSLKQKRLTQPTDKFSAGSIFKRNQQIPAKIIDELGLKGTKIGDAEISTKHAGFIVNNGNATSDDVEALIFQIQNKVFNTLHTTFELEIEKVPK